VLIPLAVVALLALCLASLAGWGGLTHRLCGGGGVPWTYRAALGVPTLALLGGPLNLLKIARPAALDALVVLGLALLAWQCVGWWRDRRARESGPGPDRWGRMADLLPRLVIGGMTLFLVVNLMPTGLFNHHDDMQKYMVPPLRMLATGTLGGNPFETTGFYSLGYQSFFQAFIVAHFPLAYLNGFDAILCFLLTGLLLDDLGRRGGVSPVFRTLAALVLVTINPQYVNISSVFSGSLCVAGLAWSGVLLGERMGRLPPVAAARAAVPVGLFAMLLMGLKLTHLPFAGLYLLILLVLLVPLAGRGPWRRVAAAVGGFLVAAVLLAAPWAALYEHSPVGPLLAYASKFAEGATQEVPQEAPQVPDDFGEGDEGGGGGDSGGGAPAPAPEGHSIAEVFSTRHVYFGQTTLAYGVVTLAVGAASLAAAGWLLRHRRDGDPSVRAQLSVAVAAGASAVVYYLATPFVFSPVQAVRYVAPFLIPTAALAVLSAARAGAGTDALRTATRGLVLASCAGLVLGLFTRAAVDRIDEAATARTVVSFPFGPPNQRYHIYALGPRSREVMRTAQERIPAGEPILAWVNTPFHLDFRRNRIYTIPDPDFSRRWLAMPVTDDPDELAAYLRGHGIHYLIWGYNAPAMRSEHTLQRDLQSGWYAWRGIITMRFKERLTALAHAGDVLYDDGRTVAFRLPEP
jgi:hypothetical protein